ATRPAGAGTAPGVGQPLLPPREAYRRGWMPLAATGVTAFRRAYPTYDGRGVIIGILDSGLDPGIPGLGTTTTGERKVLDLRDFSGEGSVALVRLTAAGDTVVIAGRAYGGLSRVRALTAGPLFGGAIRELPLGEMPASDLNGNGTNTDTLALLVARAPDGWVVFADTDGDGSLGDERPVHDYLAAREIFGWAPPGAEPRLHLAVNLREERGVPHLDLYFDTSAHGSHVAGIAAGHNLYGVEGFDGVAPGALLLGLKIADNAQGGISTTGSMRRALAYAVEFARARRMPLVLNMSFGVGNEQEGAARIDSLVDSVLAANPDVVFAISAGNDGPGLSTMGFPGSAPRAIAVGATYPAVFLGAGPGGHDPVAFFSSRGGELAKPDLVTPGVAYSTVPRWNTGGEQKGGTSMAAPHAAGLAALLVSGLVQTGRPVIAGEVRRALMVTARPALESTYLDQGTGVPDVGAAWRWLEGRHSIPEVGAVALSGGTSAAFRVVEPGTAPDTTFRFRLTSAGGPAGQRFALRSNAAWLRAPETVTLDGGTGEVTLAFDRILLARPGVYTGVVTGWTPDTLAGPAFRLVSTVVVPEQGDPVVARLGRIPAGGTGRVFFRAEAARPFAAAFATGSRGEQVLAYLHEPHGQPYREENGIAAGHGEEAGGYVVDARDVVPGLYEAVAVAPPLQSADVTIVVQSAPVTIQAGRGADHVRITLRNRTKDPVTTEPFAMVVGAEQVVNVTARGSAVQHVRFQVPDWAVHAVVDVAMPREQWPRFTDFGVTVFDSAGRQLGKSPLNYAFGRLHLTLPGSAFPAEVALFPGFSDPGDSTQWVADVSVRLYADSAHVVRLERTAMSLAPGAEASATVPWREPSPPLAPGFAPLAIIVVPERERTWTREVSLPAPSLSRRP
ncbi:MAG TPA: S8 family serine peptidase, partial [Gemmatimonadales bacterium]|nr:S8 family serine peptidase [Gemmatimonadales bacterium]